ESFFLTHALDDAVPLGAFLERTLPGLPPGRQARLRLGLAEALGRLVAQMHDAGVLHNDFHAGNLLVRLEDDRPELFVIDLHAVRVGGPLGWRQRRGNLVMLNRWFVLRAGRADRLRFWRTYFGRCRSSAGPYAVLRDPQFRELARDLERRTWASNLGFW